MKTTATVIPQPISIQHPDAGAFLLSDGADIGYRGAGSEPVARWLAGQLQEDTGLTLITSADADGNAAIQLILAPGEAPSGQAGEGYRLTVTSDGIRLGADTSAGLFWGAQSLRQLIPATATAGAAPGRPVAAVDIADYPRYAYRGVMLDVARHFFSVDDVKRYIDDVAALKINHLHLHLTDDQGWRLHINSWPDLTAPRMQTEVGGGEGGFYSQDQYREIVAYAASRHITTVPEIDMPGHTNAALAAYPELNPDSTSPAVYSGVEVGFSSLWIESETTYRFLDDVLREVAALTPGPYLHLGGDESLSTTPEDFLVFMERVTSIAARLGKTVIGWQELGRSRHLPAGTIGQYWDFLSPRENTAAEAVSFVEQEGAVILSPADVAYLDMKYTDDSPMGLTWADGTTSVRQSYSWEPDAVVPGLSGKDILGIGAPLWTETIPTISDVEYMVFPRLAAIAELAWSAKPTGARDFAEFAQRLASLGEHWDAAGVAYYRDPEVPWRAPESKRHSQHPAASAQAGARVETLPQLRDGELAPR